MLHKIRKKNEQQYEPESGNADQLKSLFDSQEICKLFAEIIYSIFLFSIFSDVNLKSSNKVLKIKYFIVVTFHPNFNKAKTFRAILYI